MLRLWFVEMGFRYDCWHMVGGDKLCDIDCSRCKPEAQVFVYVTSCLLHTLSRDSCQQSKADDGRERSVMVKVRHCLSTSKYRVAMLVWMRDEKWSDRDP